MNLRRSPPLLVLAAVGLRLVGCAHAGEVEAAYVLGVRGMPMVVDASGVTRRAKALQGLVVGETLVLERGDAVTACLQDRGGVEVAGPGTVRIASSDVGTVAGAPRITRKGRCETASEADSNGGVILRHLSLHGRSEPAVGQ